MFAILAISAVVFSVACYVQMAREIRREVALNREVLARYGR
jgi:hypothetical protein